MDQTSPLQPMEPSFKYGAAGFSLFYHTPLYTMARTVFARADQQMAFLINRLRADWRKTRRVAEVEATLSQTLAALDHVIATLPPEDQVEVRRYQAQTSVLLSQIRGDLG